jgi:hypothetical protein
MPECLSYQEAARFCGLRSPKLLQIAVRNGELQCVQLGYKTRVFEQAELERWLATKKTRRRRLCYSNSKSSSAISPVPVSAARKGFVEIDEN